MKRVISRLREQEYARVRRERIATAALQGILASMTEDCVYSTKDATKAAIEYTDELIAALDGEHQNITEA